MDKSPKRNLEELKDFIIFAKQHKIPGFTLGDFACTLPPKDANESKLEALERDIEQIRSITNKLLLSLENSRPVGMNSAPFTTRINAVRKDG